MCFMMRDAMGAIIETMDPGHLRLIKTTAGGVAAVVAFAALFQTECGLQSFDWMVPAIVIANIVCYVMSYYLPAVGNFEEWEWYVARENMSHKTLLSYQFAHASIGHITANMLTLIMVGSEVSQALGCNQLLFLALYLASGWVGGLFAALLSDAHTCTVGASGSVAGVIVALSVLRPNSAVYLLGDDTASNPLMLLMGTLVADLCRGGNISWEGHLGGGIAGGTLALLFQLLKVGTPAIALGSLGALTVRTRMTQGSTPGGRYSQPAPPDIEARAEEEEEDPYALGLMFDILLDGIFYTFGY